MQIVKRTPKKGFTQPDGFYVLAEPRLPYDDASLLWYYDNSAKEFIGYILELNSRIETTDEEFNPIDYVVPELALEDHKLIQNMYVMVSSKNYD